MQMQFGERLYSLIADKGFSVRGFAHAWKPDNPEYGRRKLYGYLREGHMPNRETLESIADVLGVSTDELLSDSDEEDESSFLSAVQQLQQTAAALALMADKMEKRKRSAA